MPVDLVTTAIIDALKSSLNNRPSASYDIKFASPGEGAADANLVIFPYLVTPAYELRNAERVRRWPTAGDPPRTIEPAVPVELHYLVAVGEKAPTGIPALGRLADAIGAVESLSPLAVPAAFQEAIYLSLLPLSSDEMARIWGLFPNANCRASFAFRASPVWIDPRAPRDVAAPVTKSETEAGRLAEAG